MIFDGIEFTIGLAIGFLSAVGLSIYLLHAIQDDWDRGYKSLQEDHKWIASRLPHE